MSFSGDFDAVGEFSREGEVGVEGELFVGSIELKLVEGGARR